MGASEVRAKGAGAALWIGGEKPRGRLWVRGGSTVRAGEDAEGRIVVDLTEGEARLAVIDPATDARVLAAGQPVVATGEDLLLRKARGGTEVVPTASHLAAADWSLTIGEPRRWAGVGSLETRSARGDAGSRLALTSLRVAARPAGDFVEAEVEHVFHNASSERLEGTFRFPLPDRAILTGLAMEIGGRMMEGEIAEIEKARRVYDEIVDSMQDPALLEWEHGNTFKLRVFPIEPASDKRVVLRYLAPLRRGPAGWSFAYETAAPGLEDTIGHVRVDFDGKTVVNEDHFAPGRTVEVAVAKDLPAAVREVRSDGIYTAVRVQPPFEAIPASGPAPRGRVLVAVVDTSRSSLEERPLALDALRGLLDELGPDDRFLVVASDIVARDHASAPVEPTAASIAAAIAFVDGIEPDGASDLGLALRHAGELAARVRAEGAPPGGAASRPAIQVVYLGDGLPTWGTTDASALRALASEKLSGASLHTIAFGRDAREEDLRALAEAGGGWAMKPTTAGQVKRLAVMLARAGEVRSLRNVRIAAGAKDEVAPLAATSLVEGDELEVLVRTPPGEAPPASLELVADATAASTSASEPAPAITRRIPVPEPAVAGRVAERWAARRIAGLEAAGAASKEQVVKLSLDFGVMSKHTAFLVLESEEAYEKYAIERRQAKRQADGDPKVSGADLESVSERQAQATMDRIQPGDPEILVPAPADARSVVVVFPFGDTKVAVYEPELRSWSVRFLVDAATPDGTYEAVVRVTHADGRLELSRLPYVVDTKKPVVRVELEPLAGSPGSFEVRASQVLTDDDVRLALPEPLRGGSIPGLRRRFGARVADLARVEVRFPDGTVLPLDRLEPGELAGVWSPAEPPGDEVELQIVAVDRALNQSSSRVVARLEAR